MNMTTDAQQVNIRLTRRHKRIAIAVSKAATDSPRPDCGSVSHGVRVALELADKELLDGRDS
jgi:hypothetical protein